MSPSELELITADRPAEETVPETGVLKRLVKNRDLWLLTLSYLCMNYVFYIFFTWFYIYLVDVRGFGLLEGGFFASLPFIVGSFAATAGGWTCDHLCRRIGPRWGCRLPGIAGMVLVAVFLVLGALATNAVAAVVLLSICFASTQFTEGAYWAGATYIGGRHTSAATGVLNTGGNLGGVISAPLIPILVDHFGWLIALSTGSVFALVGAVLWLWVRADEPLLPRRSRGPIRNSYLGFATQARPGPLGLQFLRASIAGSDRKQGHAQKCPGVEVGQSDLERREAGKSDCEPGAGRAGGQNRGDAVGNQERPGADRHVQEVGPSGSGRCRPSRRPGERSHRRRAERPPSGSSGARRPRPWRRDRTRRPRTVLALPAPGPNDAAQKSRSLEPGHQAHEQEREDGDPDAAFHAVDDETAGRVGL